MTTEVNTETMDVVKDEVVPAITDTPDEVTTQSHKATLDFEISTNKSEAFGQLSINLPSDLLADVAEILKNTPKRDFQTGKQTRLWVDVVKDGLSHIPLALDGGSPQAMFNRKDSNWNQGVAHNGLDMSGHVPHHKTPENQKLYGESALLRIMSALEIGTLFNTPLWHTGIWITFKAPSEAATVELQRTLAADKVRYGRSTYGLLFSNISVYTVDRLVDLALSHLYTTTAKLEDESVAHLRSLISSRDYPSLIWGFVNTMYPSGFNYSRACVVDPEICNHVSEARLNLSKLQVVDDSALTEWQKVHMSSITNKSKDLDSIKKYQSELLLVQDKRVAIKATNGTEIFVTFKTPSIEAYVESGQVWIGSLVRNVEAAFDEKVAPGVREGNIRMLGQSTLMRQFAHSVKCIEFNSNIIEDVETINSVLGSLSADEELTKMFTKAAVDYNDMSTMATIGIPTYNCPNCNKDQAEAEKTLPRLVTILPLDMLQVFFSLHYQRLQKIDSRMREED
jgi:hypothetical protein